MNRLKELRKEKKQTQKEFAKETGTPLRTLQSWENGESQIKPDKAQQLADYFGVPVGYLLGYTDNPKIYDDEIVKEVSPGHVLAVSLKRWQEESADQVKTDFVRFLSDNSIFLSDKEIKSTLKSLYNLSTNHGKGWKTKRFQEIFTNPDHKHYKGLFEEYSYIFGNEFARNVLEEEINAYIKSELKTQARAEKLLEVLKSAYGERNYLD